MPDFNYMLSRVFMVALHAAAAVPVIERGRRCVAAAVPVIEGARKWVAAAAPIIERGRRCVAAASDAIGSVRKRLVEDEGRVTGVDFTSMRWEVKEKRAEIVIVLMPRGISTERFSLDPDDKKGVPLSDAFLAIGEQVQPGQAPTQVGGRFTALCRPIMGGGWAALADERHLFAEELAAAAQQKDGWPPNARIAVPAVRLGFGLGGHLVLTTDEAGRLVSFEGVALERLGACTHVLVARVPPPSADTNDNAA